MRKFSNINHQTKIAYSKDILNNPNHLPISFGEYTYGTPQILSTYMPCGVDVGKFCSIAPGVKIVLDLEHRTDWVTTYPFPISQDFPEAASIIGHPCAKGDVHIGNDVWIGMDAVILSGVTIGDGAVVGACSLVTKDIPPYAIAVGNPAQVIKFRFSDDVIERLLHIQWWNWPIEKIRRYIPVFCADPQQFFEFLDQETQEISAYSE